MTLVDTQRKVVQFNKLLSTYHSQYRLQLNSNFDIELLMSNNKVGTIKPEDLDAEVNQLVTTECKDHM